MSEPSSARIGRVASAIIVGIPFGLVFVPIGVLAVFGSVSFALRAAAVAAWIPLVLVWVGLWWEGWRGRSVRTGMGMLVVVFLAAQCAAVGEMVWSTPPLILLAVLLDDGAGFPLAYVHPWVQVAVTWGSIAVAAATVAVARRQPWWAPLLMPVVVWVCWRSHAVVLGVNNHATIGRRDPLPSSELRGTCVGVMAGRWWADGTSYSAWPLPLVGTFPPSLVEVTVHEDACTRTYEVRCPEGTPEDAVRAGSRRLHPKMDLEAATWTDGTLRSTWRSRDPTCDEGMP